jgi:hypothetical protein
VLKFCYADVSSQRRLQSLFTHDPNADMRCLYHGDVVPPVADSGGACAAVRLEQQHHRCFLRGGAAAANLRERNETEKRL